MKRRAKRLLSELDQEIREHTDLATPTRVKEDAREVWTAVWLEQFVQDVRFALRGLRRTPVFTVVAILTLAIGIGANTTIFSAINALLLRPLAYPDQDRLVRVLLRDPKYPQYGAPVSWTDVAHWKAANDVFEQIEATSGPDIVAMTGGGSGECVGVQHCNPLLPPMLGVKAYLGSLPTDENKDAVGFGISYEFWQRHFRGDPHVWARRFSWTPDLGRLWRYSSRTLICCRAALQTYSCFRGVRIPRTLELGIRGGYLLSPS